MQLEFVKTIKILASNQFRAFVFCPDNIALWSVLEVGTLGSTCTSNFFAAETKIDYVLISSLHREILPYFL